MKRARSCSVSARSAATLAFTSFVAISEDALTSANAASCSASAARRASASRALLAANAASESDASVSVQSTLAIATSAVFSHKSSALMPSALGLLASAPRSSSTLAALRFRAFTAACSAVIPLRISLFGSAPKPRSSAAAAASPWCLAWSTSACKATSTSLPAAAPSSSSTLDVSAHAAIKHVPLEVSRSTLAPPCMSAFMTSPSPSVVAARSAVLPVDVTKFAEQ
mmetsp:Transcript_5652/g.14729  ORF Transcript_5652/g.14729 Transcript_5652/m.14729 type:complete len:226 (-) Transcript_5652:263-940(-)